MVDAQPTKSGEGVSLACAILGCIGSAGLPALNWYLRSQDPTGASGVLALYLGLLSAALCLAGVIFGVVALRQMRRGKSGRRARAWTGIILGCLPFAVFLAWALPGWWEELWIRIGSPRSRQKKAQISVIQRIRPFEQVPACARCRKGKGTMLISSRSAAEDDRDVGCPEFMTPGPKSAILNPVGGCADDRLDTFSSPTAGP